MRIKLLSLLMLLLTLTLWSQKKSDPDFTISFNGNKIETASNYKQHFKGKKNSRKQIPKEEYTLLQFTTIPTADEQKKLKAEGITLLSYFSNNAYYAKISSNFYSKSSAPSNIRTSIDIDSKYKLDPEITKEVIPDYAKQGNSIKVIVSYFKGVDSNVISQDLTTLFIKNINIDPIFNEIKLEASKEKLEEIARLNWVQNIELVPPPVESDNKPGVSSHKANILGSVIPGLGYGLTGKNVKVGVWDGNIEPHKDHTGRIINREYEYNSSHGAHVSGTIGGAGLLDPKARGMAPEVQLFGWNFNTQSNGLSVQQERVKAANEDGIELTSNSYGIKLASGFNTGRYNAGDRGDDNVTVMYPYLLNVYSNGNDQAAYAGGFNTSTKNSKNALHVAANNPNDLISSYSSFGPTIDGRLVPQIAAVGTDVYSLDYSNSYQVMSGTSMATPGTTGTIALLYQRFKNTYNNTKPLASLMKALVTNTAKDAGNPGPDYKYGFGNLNGLRAIKALDNKTFYTGTVTNGIIHEKDIVVPAGLVSLKVMLAYSDLPGTPGASNIQVNDLDIKIVKDGVTTLPWVLNPTTPNANATRGVDNLNNIEQITLDSPAAGTYKIVVTGTEIPLNSQEFSVVYDFVAPELILTYPVGGEKFNPETTEYIRWDYEGEAKPFTLEYSIDGGNTYQLIAKDIPAAARNFAWKVPAGKIANAKIRVIAGSKVSFSKDVFNIIKEPENLVIAPSNCGTSSYQMDWNAIPDSKYEVLKMNGYKFDVVATVTSPTYTFSDVTPGEDNWFSVRAIDIPTGIVSERVRAVNVEPVSQPVLNAVNLPFIEDFNSRKATNYVFSTGSTGLVKYEYIDAVRLDAAKMAGSGTPSTSPWVASTIANAFTNNPDYIKKVTFCDIDATTLAGKVLRLKFNLVWKSVPVTNRNFFRLVINGTPVTSTQNVSVYGGTDISGDTELLYDLSAYAGTNFSVDFESVIGNNAIVVSNELVYNAVYIDNVTIFEATATDLALSSLTPNTGLTAAETVKIKVYNHSPVTVSDVPVSYKINNGAEVTETIPGPIAPLSEASYDFVQKADFSAKGVYTVLAKVNYAADTVIENNTLSKEVANPGSDILMGSRATFKTCSAIFTDGGSQYGNYGNQLTQTLTFKPATPDSSIKVEFSEFELEQDYDFLYVYSGPDINSRLLGAFTGNSLPASLTSTSFGGELTFKFVSDEIENAKGWAAAISCVPKLTLNDVKITSIVSPEVLGKKTNAHDITIRVTNLESNALIDYPVFYQVNGAAKVIELIPTISAYATVDYTFTTKADLSIVDATYTIKSGVDIADDNAANDTLEKIVSNKNELPVHTNTDGFAISKLKWNDVVNSSGTTAYSDFKSIKIPVYAGFTYQPEVSITKPENPISKDLVANVGVFTMIVIDLNGDGDLTDEFYAGNFWVNTTTSSPTPAIPSTKSTHYFLNNFTLVGGLTIPTGTTAGEKLMRVIHMFRSSQESYNVNLGPTIDGLTSSRDDFEVEEYTINVLPFTAANAAVERIVSPIKPGKAPVNVTVTIRNLSDVAISNFPVAYSINGGTEVLGTYTGPSIATGKTANYTFPTKANLVATGDYTIEVYTKLAGDTDPTNDLKSIVISHVPDYATNVVGTFDGINDFIKTDVTPALNLTNNYTYELWVNQKASTVYGRLLDKSTALAFIHNNSNLSIYKENSLVISITTAAGSYVINTAANSIKQNTWHHIAYTVSAANVYTVYIDGVAVPYTSTGTAGAASSNTSEAAYIGNNAGLARGLNGNIDEVRIWAGVRSQATINANATTRYIGNEPGLLAYYPFSEGNKQFVFDRTISDNTAIVTNADTEGLGEGKFWNIPVLLQKIDFVNQLSSSYDAATKTFTVLLNDGADKTTAVANYYLGMKSIAKINGTTQVSGVTANDYTNPVTLTVEGVGFNTGLVETYTIRVLSGLSNESKLLSYDFKTASNSALSQEINTDIVGQNASKTLLYRTDVSNLIADFAVSPGAELFIDGVKQLNSKTIVSDYSNSFLVTVISENKLTQTNYAINLTVPVFVKTMEAVVDSTFTKQVSGTTTSTIVGNVTANDTLNGLAVIAANTTVTSTPTGPLSIDADGVLTLSANTPSGTYSIDYTICEDGALPANCDTQTATVVVENPMVAVVDNTYPKQVSSKTTSTLVGNVTANDTLGGALVTTANTNVTSTPTAALSIDADGVLTLSANILSGTYSIDYTICEEGVVPANCATQTATVVVENTIVAVVDNTYSKQVSGTTTPTSIGNVTANDTLNGVLVTAANTTVTSTSTTALSIDADGVLTLLPNTPSGTYSIDYTICEDGALPANCATQTATVEVENTIVAVVDNTYPKQVSGTSTSTSIGNVTANDTLNGVLVTAANTTVTSTPTTALSIDADGVLTLLPNTPSGTYSIDYTICEEGALPANCATQTATVVVENTIVAVIDNTYPIELPGKSTATSIGNVTANDTLNGALVTAANTSVTSTPTAALSIDINGVLTLLPNTPTGTYSITYTICEEGALPANCATQTATVVVGNNNVMVANNESIQVDGINGALEVINVLDNDTVNGLPIDPAEVTLTIAPSQYFEFNSDGTVNVKPNTPAGNYPIVYQICEKTNSTNCATATLTISVANSIPAIAIIKTAVFNDENANGLVNIDETVTYKFKITNTGNVPLTGITVTDPLPGVILTGQPIDLDVNEIDEHNFTATYTITQSDLNKGNVTNQASVRGTTANGIVVTDLSDDQDNSGNKPTVLPIAACAIKVFNGFSPNGDNKNKRFYIKGLECYPDNTVEIFNRWGVRVFNMDNYNNEDRVFKGYSEGHTVVKQSEELPVGTYYYMLKYKDANQNPHELSGYLYIQR